MMNWFLQNWVVDPKWKPTNLYTWEPFCPNHPAKMNCHRALLRSDGNAVAFGGNTSGQCNLPPLDDGISYTQVSARAMHTVLLRSDGRAVAFGGDTAGQCKLPTPDPGTWYVADVSVGQNLVLQLECARQDDAMLLICSGLTGQETIRLNASPSDPAWNTQKRIARELQVPLQSLRVVLPDGQLLAAVCQAKPGASLADVSEARKLRCLS